MGKDKGNGDGRKDARKAKAGTAKLDPMIKELCARFARIEAWFEQPVFECGKCARRYIGVAFNVGGAHSGVGLFGVQLRQVASSALVGRLAMRIHWCCGCRPGDEEDAEHPGQGRLFDGSGKKEG